MVQVKGITKRFGPTLALNDVTLDVHRGEFFTIIGPSGCGKTTLLKTIAGLEKPDTGQVLIDGVDVTNAPTARRGISLVFQDFALFPHKTVFENIAFGLRMRGESEDSVKDKVNETMKLVGLEALGNRYPRQLSGGQQQRVAVARSVVIEPKLLLFDEPLGNLDLKLQKKMEVELKFLQQRIGITFVYVTHNQEQAMVMGHRIAVMNHGVIEQIGTPEEVYARSNTIFVAKFVGEINMLKGRIDGTEGGLCVVETDIGSFVGVGTHDIEEGSNVAYAIRPENIVFVSDASGYRNKARCAAIRTIYKGSEFEYLANLDAKYEFKVVKQSKLPNQKNENIFLAWRPEDAVVIEKPSVVDNIDIDRVILGD